MTVVPGIGTHRYSHTWPYGTNYQSYDYFLTSADNIDLAIAQVGRGSGRANPARVEQYFSYQTSTVDLTSISVVMKYDQAVANDWICHKWDGSYLGTPGFLTSLVTKVGDPAFQAAYIANLTAILAGYPLLDGVFLDIIYGDLPSYRGGNGEGHLNEDGSTGDFPNEYPNQASWRAAMASFIAAVGPAVQALGYGLTVNGRMGVPSRPTATNNGTTDAEWMTQLAPYLTGWMKEFWLQNNGVPDWQHSEPSSNSHATFNDNWDRWITLHDTCNAHGLAFYPYTHTSTGPSEVQPLNPELGKWARANFLLGWDGATGAAICRTYDKTIDPWSPVWTMDVGQPLNAMYQVGVQGGYRRDFTKGTAIVNPNATRPVTFYLGGDYQTPDNSIVSQVTLAPVTALVLSTVGGVARPSALATLGADLVQFANGDLAGLT